MKLLGLIVCVAHVSVESIVLNRALYVTELGTFLILLDGIALLYFVKLELVARVFSAFPAWLSPLHR